MSTTKLISSLLILYIAIVSSHADDRDKEIIKPVAQVWSEKNYQGATTNLTITIGGSLPCTPFPDDFKKSVRSLKVFDIVGSLLFFSGEKCGLKSAQLIVYPKQEIPDLNEVVGLPRNYSLKSYELSIAFIRYLSQKIVS